MSFPSPNVVDPGGLNFGLGITDFSQVFDVEAIGHGGSSLGYKAAALYFPETGTSLALMINTGEAPERVAGEIMMAIWLELRENLEGYAFESQP